MFLFIALALLLLLAILGTIAYLCAKRRKEKPKKREFSTDFATGKSQKKSTEIYNPPFSF